MGRKRSLAGLTLVLALTATTALAAVPGDLDRTFGTDGHLITEFNSGNSSTAQDAVVDSSGRLVVVGADGPEIGVARFNPDGSFDTTFGGDGDIQIDSGTTTGGEKGVAVSIDPATGNILVLGEAALSGNIDIVVARVQPGGALDNTFDGPSGTGDGRFRFDFNATESGADIIPAGTNVVYTQTVGAGSSRVARIVQLTSTGALDTANFGNPNGYFDFQWAASTDSFANGLARQSDGKFVVSGSINGTATYGVARISTNGSLDTTFNPAGTIPGIARPALPAGFIDAEVRDVVIDSNGITVAGHAQRNMTGGFDIEAMLSRVSDTGALVTAFGNSSGYALLSLSADDDEVFSEVSSLDGRLFAGGTAPIGGVSPYMRQFAALFTSVGVLDTSSFASPNGYITSDLGVSTTGVAAPVAAPPAANAGVAYLVGQGAGNVIGASAVCLFMPPACPSPEMPVVQAVSPSSGANDNNPRVSGIVPAGAPVSAVDIFTNASCTGSAAASGTQALFETTGIVVPVPDNSTSAFYARARNPNGSSACSTTSVAYSEVTPPSPLVNPAPAPNKRKKCKKKKKQNAAAAKKCKKRRK